MAVVTARIERTKYETHLSTDSQVIVADEPVEVGGQEGIAIKTLSFILVPNVQGFDRKIQVVTRPRFIVTNRSGNRGSVIPTYSLPAHLNKN